MNLRGEYEQDGYVVTAHHWWSRKDRRDARMVLKLIVAEAPRIEREAMRAATHAMVYGELPPLHVNWREGGP